MSSILTNNGAMVALQTMRQINRSMEATQSQISTGLKVATAKDNAATWAISKVMDSDVKGFTAISESLRLGTSTVAVARSASDSVLDMLGEIKKLIVSAQEDNVDREKLQNELSSLRNQIGSITGAAQFNGLNLLSNDGLVKTGAVNTANLVRDAGAVGTVGVLSSLDRAASGSVSASEITVARQDLTMRTAVRGAGTDIAATALAGAGAIANEATVNHTINGDATTLVRNENRVLAGDSYAINGIAGIAADTIVYVARDGDTVQDIARGLVDRINFHAAANGVNVTAAVGGPGNNLVAITNNTGTAFTTTSQVNTAGADTVRSSGGLELLNSFNIGSENGARAALGAIEGLIQSTIDAGAAFGTVEKRMEIQNDFVRNLMDSLKSGIGALVDADMEETSARLQALQVQQQLGIQSLSVANQQPQNILALFR